MSEENSNCVANEVNDTLFKTAPKYLNRFTHIFYLYNFMFGYEKFS